MTSACEDGIHADPNNCAQFYQCANGHQYPMQECPEGLLYNAEKEYCDWPENVDCSVSKWSCFKDCVGGKWWNPMIRHKCWRNCRKGKMIETDMYKGFSGKVERKTCEEGIYKHPFRLIFNYFLKLKRSGFHLRGDFLPEKNLIQQLRPTFILFFFEKYHRSSSFLRLINLKKLNNL